MATERFEGFLVARRFDTHPSGVTRTGGGMFSLFDWAIAPSERDLVREEARFCETFRERATRFGKKVSFSAIPAAVIAPKVIAVFSPKRT